MGCCYSKGDHEHPPSFSSTLQASAAAAASTHQDLPLTLAAAKSAHLSPKPAADMGSRGKFEPVPGPLGDKTSSALTNGERSTCTPIQIPSFSRKTAVNVCLETSNILDSSWSSVQTPGPGVAPTKLTAAIERAQNMSSDEEGWKELAKRLQHLAYLIQRVAEAPGDEIEDIVSSCLKPAAGQLEQLAIEIDKVGGERKALRRFLTSKSGSNSIASHHKVLDRRISELTSKLCMDTALTVRGLQEELKQISENLDLMKGQGDLPVVAIEMRGNRITNVGGTTLSNLRFGKGVRASMVGNTGNNIGGDAFSNITFSDGRERDSYQS